MLGRACQASFARVAAILVAATLTGTPRVLALYAPAETHRCSCKLHASDHHECECALCQRAALAARTADTKAPPCHRAAARNALSRSEQGRSRREPCVEGRCGFPGGPITRAAGVEPFYPRAPGIPALMGRDETLPERVSALRRSTVEPETPPPRVS